MVRCCYQNCNDCESMWTLFAIGSVFSVIILSTVAHSGSYNQCFDGAAENNSTLTMFLGIDWFYAQNGKTMYEYRYLTNSFCSVGYASPRELGSHQIFYRLVPKDCFLSRNDAGQYCAGMVVPSIIAIAVWAGICILIRIGLWVQSRMQQSAVQTL